MKRREFIVGLGGATGWPLATRAQQSNQIRRIGVLAGNADTPENRARVVALRKSLLELGWSEDRNVRFDIRWPGPNPQHIERETADLIATDPAVIVSGTSIAIAQIRRTSPATAVVFAGITDPVGQGLVASLARPGGNVTGFAAYEVSLGGKWLETLKEMSPTLVRAAIVYEPVNAPYMSGMVRAIAAAASTGVEVIDMAVRNVAELENAIANLGQRQNSGLIVPPAGFTLNHFALILALTAKYRLPAIYAFRTIAAEGGLISYGPDGSDQWRRAAEYVDRILRGTKPSDLPVQAPLKYELVINLKTATALGLTVPPTLLARADEVIE